MKILVVEDNIFSRTLLKKTLSKVGFEVVVAESGEVAWEVVQQEDPPRLALIDWVMPGMSGIELCRRIRELNTAFPIYVILLTAKSAKEDVLEGFAAGADDFIAKPFDSGELLARIKVGRRVVEQHALLHCLIDSIPDPIYFKDSAGRYLGCNKAYEAFSGQSKSEIVAGAIPGFSASESMHVSHKEDLRLLASGESVESEGWVEAADGTKVYHSTLKLPYLESAAGSSGMIGISRDLTRRIQIEQEMQRLAVAVEQSAEAIMITDVSGRILYVNAAFEVLSGYSLAEATGNTPCLLKSGEQDADYYAKLWATISSGKTWEGRITNRTKGGDLYHAEVVIYPIRNQVGDLVNYVSISRDITQEMAIETHLRQQQKMNAVGELAGGIAHDFNNILTAILGYVALCINSVEEESKAFAYLSEIVKAGERASKLVRQILTFSRQEEQAFHEVALQSIIEDSLNMVQTTMKQNISVEMKLDSDCGPILGNTTQLQQVMVNLCTNAVHALGQERPGILEVILAPVEVSGDEAEQLPELEPGFYARVTVRDTGCGMPPDVVERIFEPYFTTKKKGEGTGFGLSIVHGIVSKHRGAINVESKEGAGSVFTLHFSLLPRRVVGDNKTAPKSAVEGGERLLFVDDDEAVLAAGCEILETFGCSVVTATNGRHALEIFRQDPDAFDALITDYNMPEMNGYELIRECRLIRTGLTAVLCSGYKKKVEGENLDDLSGVTFIPKPVDWREVSSLIRG